MFSKLKSMFQSAPTPALPDTVKVSDRTWNKEVAAIYRLRKGMWVHVPDLGVGIVTNVFDDATILVMLVNPDGTNKLAVNREAMGVRQAKLLEIPVPRRPDASSAKRFGYV